MKTLLVAVIMTPFALAFGPTSWAQESTPAPTTHPVKHHKKVKKLKSSGEDLTTSSNLSDSGASPTNPVNRASDKGPFTGKPTSASENVASDRKTATKKTSDSGNISDSGANPAGPTFRKSDTSPMGDSQATGPASSKSTPAPKPGDSSNLKNTGQNPSGSSPQENPSNTPTR